MSRAPALSDFERDFDAAMRRRDFAAATAVAAACRQAWPDSAQGWLLGSIVRQLQGDPSGALAVIEEWLGRHPEDAVALLQKAECLRAALVARSEVLQAITAAALHAGKDVGVLDAIGVFLAEIGEFEAAVGVADRAIDAAPDNMTLRAKRGDYLRALGRMEAAACDFEAVLQQSPTSPHPLMRLVELRRQTPQANRLPDLENALAAAQPGSENAVMLHFALAKSFEDLGEHPKSWHHLDAGNTCARARLKYEARADQVLAECLMTCFPDVERVYPDTTGERPIFIVGLPRTGTTLVERIISAHSQVHAAGELTTFSEAVITAVQTKPKNWLEYVRTWPALDPGVIARGYLAGARIVRGDKPRFCDKHPINFLKCALILRAFPNARIIHLTRHPLAACHAIYKTLFVEGSFRYAYDLDELGNYYVGYRKLMSHWHRVLPGRIFDVAYEDVVTALEPTTRRLLEYLELPFEAACLVPHKNPAASITASAVQVRQPVYDSSLHLWRHYAEQLAPLRARFEAAGIPVD